MSRPRLHSKTERLAATRRRDAVFRRALIAADSVAMLTAAYLATAVAGDNPPTPLVVLVPLLLIGLAKVMGLYDTDVHRLHKTTVPDVPALFGIAVFVGLLAFLGGDLVLERTPGRLETLLLVVLLFVLGLALRSLARLLARVFTNPERCLLLGNSNHQALLQDALTMSPATHAEVIGSLPMVVGNDIDRLSPAYLDRIVDEHMVDRVILMPGSQRGGELMLAIRELRDAGVKVSILSDMTRLAGASVEFDSVGGITLLGMRGFAITRSSRVIKRSFDLLAASAILIALLPLLAALMLLVRFESPGPALFRQERIGRYGRRFMMMKLRSMREGAHLERDGLRHLSSAGEGLFKVPDDPRVTRIGAFMRRTSIDELPQLLNVLRGDMSLVGPRPLVPEEDLQIVGGYRDRLNVRPGITGHWQILSAPRVSLEEMVKLDYIYVANWSLWNDIVLLVRTISVMVRRHGM